MAWRKRVLNAVLVAVLAVACAPTDHRVILGTLQNQLGHQYHECVPLGWNPVPASGTYYPGANVQLEESGVWLPSMWLAWVDKRSLRRADVRSTVVVLDELARIGMLAKESWPAGARYRLTPQATPYFFAESQRGTNPEAIPYLCYSSIVPQHVVWNRPLHTELVGFAQREAQVFQAEFEWTPSPVAAWANDPIVRAHGIILSPTRSPSIATFVQNDGDWYVSKLGPSEPPLGRIVDASVWPRPQF